MDVSVTIKSETFAGNLKFVKSETPITTAVTVNWSMGPNLLSPVIQFPPGSQNLVCIKGPHLILNSLRHSTNYLKYSLNQSSLHSAFVKGHMDVYVTMRSEIFAGNLKFVAKIRNPIIQLPCHSKLVYGAKLTV